ncbi:MAG: hypothetical protein CL609_00710 [Anaerolineaceae bacterium]|nr:hypothetical protein [Anaerolineaceae bacterium]
MSIHKLGFWLIIFCLILSACQSEQPLTSIEAATIVSAITDTPTITWTPRPTRMITPTITPTPPPYPLSENGPWLLVKNSNNQFLIRDLNGKGINYSSLPSVESPLYRNDFLISPNGRHFAVVIENPPDDEGNPVMGDFNNQIWIIQLPTLEIVEKIRLVSEEYKDLLEENNVLLDGYLRESSKGWSHNGRFFAFTAILENGLSAIYLYDTQTDTIFPGVNTTKHTAFVEWSPDSDLFVFNQYNDDMSEFGFGGLNHNVWVSNLEQDTRFIYQPEVDGDTLLNWLDNTTILVSGAGIEPPLFRMRAYDLGTGQMEVVYDDFFCSFAVSPSQNIFLITKCLIGEFDVNPVTFIYNAEDETTTFVAEGMSFFPVWVEAQKMFIAPLEKQLGEDQFDHHIIAVDPQGSVKFTINDVARFEVSEDGNYFLLQKTDGAYALYSSEGELINKNFTEGKARWSPDSRSIFVFPQKQQIYQCLLYRYDKENDWAENSFSVPLRDCEWMEIIQPKVLDEE